MYEYNARLVRVVDGDTIDFDLDLGFHMTARIRVRLLDVDTPELRGAERELGKEYKQWVEGQLEVAERIVVLTHKTGKYGRWLANIDYRLTGEATGRRLNEELLNKMGADERLSQDP